MWQLGLTSKCWTAVFPNFFSFTHPTLILFYSQLLQRVDTKSAKRHERLDWIFTLLRSGLNFINILRTAFMCPDPKSVKKTVKLSIYCTLLGSTSVKAARKTLVKLTPGCVKAASKHTCWWNWQLMCRGFRLGTTAFHGLLLQSQSAFGLSLGVLLLFKIKIFCQC